MMTTLLFSQYEADYKGKSSVVTRKVNSLQQLSTDLKQAMAAEIRNDLKAAEALVRRMELEAQSGPVTSSQTMIERAHVCRAGLTSLRQQAETMSASADRAALGLTGDACSSSAAQRDRMLTATQRLEKSSAKLTYASEALAEAQASGAATLAELQRQRQVIERSQQTLESANTSLDTAGTKLKGMNRKWFFF